MMNAILLDKTVARLLLRTARNSDISSRFKIMGERYIFVEGSGTLLDKLRPSFV